jgi:hypothetical protein
MYALADQCPLPAKADITLKKGIRAFDPEPT